MQTYDWSAHTDVDYEYLNPAYPLKPTHVAENIENAGGMIRHALTSYNSFGEPLQQQLYDARDPDRHAVTEFEYHPDLPLPTRQTAWQGPDKNEGPVETVSIYGEQDGTENPHGNFMVAQQVLLEQGDPNTWAITHYKYDPTGRVTEKTDPRGFRTAYEYDEHHYPACVKVGPPGTEKITQRFRHDALGQLLLQADHYGGVTLYDYDDFGFVWQIRTYTDPVAFTMDRSLFTVARYEAMTPDSTSRYGYDDFGNRTWEEKPAGGIVRTEYTRSRQPAKVTYHDYDDQQQLQEKAYLLTDYNSRGLKTGEEKYDALTDHTSYVLYGYDYLNRLTETWWLDYDDQTILKVTIAL